MLVSPPTASTRVGKTVSFVAHDPSGQATPVVWSVEETGGGTVDASGQYSAPTTPGTYHVVATSTVDATRAGSATVTVGISPVQVTISPQSANLSAGASQQFSAVVTGVDPGQSTAVTWSVEETGGGTIDPSGKYQAPADSGTFHVVATSVADPTQQASSTVVVSAAASISVAIAPRSASTTPGGKLNFTATVSGAAAGQSTAVTWSVQEGAGGGTVDSAGHYTAPAGTGTFHVVATSVADPSKQASATVQVSASPVIVVSVSPDPANVRIRGTQTFTATVTGTGTGQSTAVTWSVQEGAAGGSIDAAGKYTAPATPGTFHVVATSVADATKKDSATVNVSPDISVVIAPRTASVQAGGTSQFTATVSGLLPGQSPAITWSVQEGAAGGTVNGSGRYTAPAVPGTFHVVASSAADPTKLDTATVTVTPNIQVVVTPATVALTTGGAQDFAATVSGTGTGQSRAVTWSVQEPGGGTVNTSGHYTAPQAPGTFHLVATSVADPSRAGTATITVAAAPALSVTVTPSSVAVSPGGTVTFSAVVSGAGSQSTAVTWSVQEGSAGGTVDGSGHYTAPSGTGTFHVVATSVADPTKSGLAVVSVGSSTFLDPDRRTVWSPGVQGGVPTRTTVCSTVNASSFGNGSSDATSGIQAAINACPAGQVVQLSAGTFTINGGNFLLISKGITLRGAGPDQTTLQKTDGAKPGQEATGANPSPLIIVGPARWDTNTGTSTNLTADAVKGNNSVTVASAAGMSAGQFVLLDELSGAGWQTDPAGRGQIWASPDFRVVWQRHNPSQGTDDPFPAAAGWFSRQDRPTNEIKQIDHLSGNTVFFTTPIHISYRTSHTAQLSTFSYPFTQNAGVEDLKVIGGDQGNIRFQWAASSWAKRIDNTVWHDEGFAVERSFRVEIRDSYVHDAAWAQPGGAGYAISFSEGSSEVLVENSIILKANKVMVARSSGTASVFGYNYADDGYINTNVNWIEVGLNASHMVGSHHVLFEGNESFNWDSDKTHGNAIFHTVFRNHLTGTRRDFNDNAQGDGPRRCAGATYYSYWHSFVGNVLGAAGQMAGWVYESGSIDTPSIYKLGWDDWSPYPVDPNVVATTVRHGNYDYVTSSVKWEPAISDHALPASLYLSGKPAFFNAGRGYTWPWVDPTGSTQLYALPARARFEAGTPFVQP